MFGCNGSWNHLCPYAFYCGETKHFKKDMGVRSLWLSRCCWTTVSMLSTRSDRSWSPTSPRTPAIGHLCHFLFVFHSYPFLCFSDISRFYLYFRWILKDWKPGTRSNWRECENPYTGLSDLLCGYRDVDIDSKHLFRRCHNRSTYVQTCTLVSLPSPLFVKAKSISNYIVAVFLHRRVSTKAFNNNKKCLSVCSLDITTMHCVKLVTQRHVSNGII